VTLPLSNVHVSCSTRWAWGMWSGRRKATLTPFYGAAYYTEVGEAKRQALNEWIRSSKAYDAVIDFDKVTRDPENPKIFLPLYDSCDHLHPNDSGYKAMADAVDLSLFGR
jgi:lysophospholipase L1-like esterase